MRFASAAVFLLAVSVVAPAAQADWASFHSDSRNTGFVAGSSYKVYEDVWWNNKTLANAQIKASPVLKDGILITADLAGLVRALDSESGYELWRYKFAKPVEGTPAISGEVVYISDTDGNLKALNLRDGHVEHTASVGKTLSAIREHEGKVFIGTEAGEMKAFLGSSLTLLWTFSLSKAGADVDASNKCMFKFSPQPIRGAAAIFGGRVYFGSLNHGVYAINEQGRGNGFTDLEWFYQTGDVVVGAPTLDIIDASTHRLIVGSYDGYIYSFNPAAAPTKGECDTTGSYAMSNAPLWTFKVPSIVDTVTGQEQISKVHSSPANSGDKIFVGANNGHVYALRSSDGVKLWDTVAGNVISPVTASPAVASGIVVVGSEDKKVYWMNADTGVILKSFTTESAVGTSSAIDGERTFIASTDGTIYMFGPKVPPRANLVVTTLAATTAKVTATVKNIGDAASVNTTMRLFVGGTFLANVNVAGLQPAGSVDIVFAGTITKGDQSIKATADPDNHVKESNESDNDLSKTINIKPPAPPNTATGGATSEGKKSPGAGLLVIGVLLALGLLARRRRMD